MARTRLQERQRAARAASGETRQAAAKARALSARNNIAPLPRVADVARRRRCFSSLVDFAAEYCGALFARAPSERLREYAATLQRAIEGAGQIHVRMARGSGKTTWVKAALAWGLATGRLHYAVVFCAAAELAKSIVADVWSVFEGGGAFAADFPEIAYPIARAGGVQQRFAAQHWDGVRTAMRKAAREIRLPTVPGSVSSGGVLLGLGAGSNTRGLVRGNRRPDLVLLDDIQSRADAKNPARVRALSEWIDGDVQGLAGARALNAVMTSTPIYQGDLSSLYADRDARPGWHLIEFPAIEGEPRAPELWRHYGQLWSEARRDGDMAFRAATAFYGAHRAEMDAGLTVIDPGAYDTRVELSGVQHFQNLRLAMGAEAFAAEYQLQVAAAVDAVQISPALVASRVNGTARGTLPPGTVQAVAFCDVNAGAGISWACVAFGPRGLAAVVDYGRFPGGGRRLVPEGATETETQRIIAAGLAEVVRRLLDAALPVAGGAGVPEKIAAVWIDAGYQRRVVQNVCTVFRARTGRLVYASVGVAHDRYNPQGRHVMQRGDGVDYRALDGDKWFAHDADRWRERAQRAWLADPLQSGSLSVPGNNPREHEAFAEEVCAEVLAEKITDSRAVTHYFWNARPGAGNHWLDAVTGCLAMGAWYRLLDDDALAVAAMDAAPKARAPMLPAGTAAAMQGAGRARRATTRRTAQFYAPPMA